jgi:hypothetical protein
VTPPSKSGSAPACTLGWHSRPICQKRHLSRVGSLVLRIAPAGLATHFGPPRDMNRPAGRSWGRLLAGRAVRDICPAATLPTDPHPLVKFVKINRSGQHQQPRGDEILTSPATSGEPATGDHPGDLGADVITALHYLAEMINQRLQFGPSRS